MNRTTWAFLSATLLSTACGSGAVAPERIRAAKTPTKPAATGTVADARKPPVATKETPAEGPMVTEDPDEVALRELTKAYELFATFVEKSGDDPRYAEAVKRARERMEDIGAMQAFLADGLRQRRGK
ncbi:MAG TPA: hypothetical protein VHE30_16935 [Polyangiaceae bacterium]|nr:hypothetical protein [Polyangiaceae bacterium]